MANGARSTGSSVNQKVQQFAAGKLGRQVGSGECYDLANSALKSAGAKSASAYGEITDDADYVWGKEINLRELQAGDILQFRDHTISTKVTTTTAKTSPDGTVDENERWNASQFTREHHTAIVLSNDGNGVVTVLEQNIAPAGGRKPLKKVQKNRVYVADSTTESSSTRVTGKTRIRTRTVTVVRVTGKIWAYRPQAR